jgi:hypothetical protein
VATRGLADTPRPFPLEIAMTPTYSLLAALFLGPVPADRPAEPALLVVTEQPKVDASDTVTRRDHVVGRRCRACRSKDCEPCPQAFVIGDTRYEPRLRDIRLVPATRTLPGADFGLGETIPALPPRKAGYFQLPAW